MNVKVACVQQKARIYPDEDSFRERIYFFVKEAAKQNCSLITFPEGVGAMLAPQFMPRPLVKVLMIAYNEEEGVSAVRAKGKALLGRFLDKVTAGQDLAATFNETLKKQGHMLRKSYLRVFSAAAREHNMYVVGGSAYIPDEKTSRIVNASYLFGPDGEVLGYQNKAHLYIEDTHICESGDEIRVFATDFGKIGITICYEGMFPEIPRIMVLKGAKALINVSACPGEACFAKIRAGAWSRVQDNQVFGLHSCLVGRNDLSKEFTANYVGRSSILAPLDYTPDLSGVLAEGKALDSEELLVADWDFGRLDELIQKNDTQIFRDLRLDLVKKYYSEI